MTHIRNESSLRLFSLPKGWISQVVLGYEGRGPHSCRGAAYSWEWRATMAEMGTVGWCLSMAPFFCAYSSQRMQEAHSSSKKGYRNDAGGGKHGLWGVLTGFKNSMLHLTKRRSWSSSLLCTGSCSSSGAQHAWVAIWWSDSTWKQSINEGTWAPSHPSRDSVHEVALQGCNSGSRVGLPQDKGIMLTVGCHSSLFLNALTSSSDLDICTFSICLLVQHLQPWAAGKKKNSVLPQHTLCMQVFVKELHSESLA